MPFYASGYKQIAFTDFSGGLNLRDKSDAVGDKQAIDLLNVTFTERGAIRQRDGYDDLSPSDLTNRVDSLSAFYKADGTRQLVAGCGSRLETLTTAGAVAASLAGLAGGPWQFVRFGAPGSETLYACNGADTSPIRGKNFGDLTPGDGEQIMTAVTWRELIFVFKETKFFVLWGESANTDGTPIANFREVVNQVGLASKMAVAVGRDGVYFFNRMGVYRTTGGNPELISDVIRPLWFGDPEVYYQGSPINLNQLGLVRMAWHAEQVFIAVPTGSSAFNDRLLVYDTEHNWWSVWDYAASALAPFRRVERTEMHHGYSTGPQRVGHRTYGANLDRGQRMTSRWRSGWSDYGTSQQTTIRETRVWGSGVVNAGFSVDFYRDDKGSEQVYLTPAGSSWIYDKLTQRGGTYAQLKLDFTTYTDLTANRTLGATINQVLVRYALRAFVFSTRFSNHPASDTWSVHRVARNVREIREASVS
jgi:hypothetical protein